MKLRHLFIIAVLMLGCVSSIYAKGYKSAKVYMFGFAASFNDSTVYLTDIQQVNVYLVNNRTHFLANYQLRDYLQANSIEAHPTCITLFAENEKSAMKKYQSLKKRYMKSKNKYFIKDITSGQFVYKTVIPAEETADNEQSQGTEKK